MMIRMHSLALMALLVAGPALLTASPALAATAKVAAPHPGEAVYKNICQACHMANGKGGVGAGVILPLANNEKLEYPEYPISLVVQGRGAMPWFRDALTPQQIADVVAYVRINFGNKYRSKVTPEMVKEIIGDASTVREQE